MTKPATYRALSRLLTILDRSMPVYLTNTSPWISPGEEEILASVRRIGEDEHQLAGRVAEYTADIYGPPDRGEFPIDFFDTHDLSLDYLIKKLALCQKRDIEALERVAGDLSYDRHAQALADEALGAARGHLETLEELAQKTAKSTVS